MPRKLLLSIVVLALLSISYGLPQKRASREKRSSLDDALDVEAGHWKKWCTDVVQPEDLEKVATILVNHRLDVKALRQLSAVNLVSTGIKLGDAQRLLAKANETATPTSTTDSSATNTTTADNSTATALPQPVIVISVTLPANQSNATAATSTTNQTSSADVSQSTPYQSVIIAPQPPVVTQTPPVITSQPASNLNADTTSQTLDWITFLRGLVSDNDLIAVANRLVAHRLSPADLPLVCSQDLLNLGLTLGDAVRILAKHNETQAAAQASSAATATTTTDNSTTAAVNNTTVVTDNRKPGTPIDIEWIDDVVVDPKDIDTILSVFTANRITTVEDLTNLAVGDLVRLGLSLGDASRINKKARESAPASTASATNATPASVGSSTPTDNSTAPVNVTSTAASSVTSPAAAIKVTFRTGSADSADSKHVSIEVTIPVNTTADNSTTAANATASNSNSTVNATSGPPQSTIGILTPIIANNTNGTTGVPVSDLTGANAPVFTVTPVETPVVTVAAHPISNSRRRRGVQQQQQQNRGRPQARPAYKPPASQGRRRSL